MTAPPPRPPWWRRKRAWAAVAGYGSPVAAAMLTLSVMAAAPHLDLPPPAGIAVGATIFVNAALAGIASTVAGLAVDGPLRVRAVNAVCAGVLGCAAYFLLSCTGATAFGLNS